MQQKKVYIRRKVPILMFTFPAIFDLKQTCQGELFLHFGLYRMYFDQLAQYSYYRWIKPAYGTLWTLGIV